DHARRGLSRRYACSAAGPAAWSFPDLPRRIHDRKMRTISSDLPVTRALRMTTVVVTDAIAGARVPVIDSLLIVSRGLVFFARYLVFLVLSFCVAWPHSSTVFRDRPPRMNRNDALTKVPAVTLTLWIIKILATTLGETGGD